MIFLDADSRVRASCRLPLFVHHAGPPQRPGAGRPSVRAGIAGASSGPPGALVENPAGTQNIMANSDKSKLLKLNTAYWLTAMVVPAVLHFGLSSTKFPWPVIL